MAQNPDDILYSAVKRGQSVAVTLPDGSRREFPGPVSGAQLAAAIGPGLAKAALAVKIDGRPRDLATLIDHDSNVAIITREMPEGVLILRHDAAHVMAEAVKELYPETQVTFGPATETGFYYDFARDTPFTPEDLGRIEERMREIVRRDEPIAREVWERDRAVQFFSGIGERYKAEYIGEIPAEEEISLYRQGNFVDLCTGPHLPSTGRLGQAFKLMNVAGAYWRGDSNNAQLQRVYGTAWPNQKELDQHLFRLEEAERRDHRRVSPEVRGTRHSRCERNQGAGENKEAKWQQIHDRPRLRTHAPIVPGTRPMRDGSWR
jgi:threonyl-tRNA synthetase